MSDEFKNINDTGSEPEKGMEHSNDGSYTQGDSFVMRSSEENEKKTEESRETSQEPQEAPSEENPYYAHTYRKASEPRQESGTGFTEKSTAGPEINTVLTSSLLPYLRRRKKRRKKEMVPAQ